MKKKSPWKIIAVVTAVVGALVAVAGYIKKKSKKISDELDFDNSMFFEEDTSLSYDDDDSIQELSEIDGVADQEENSDSSDETDKNEK